MGKLYFLTIVGLSLKGPHICILFTPTDFDLANKLFFMLEAIINSTIPHMYRNRVKTVEYKLNSPEALHIFEYILSYVCLDFNYLYNLRRRSQ